MHKPGTDKTGAAQLEGVLKAIADPSRRRILDMLARENLPVNRITGQFHISRPAVVKHLRILRSANLVVVRRQGRQRIQCLNAAPLKQAEAWIVRLESFWENSLQKLKRQIEGES